MAYTVKVDKNLIIDSKGRKFFRARNNSGSTRSPGEVVIYDTSVTYLAYTTTTSANDAKVFGMVANYTPNGAEGLVQTEGITDTSVLKVNGIVDIAAGDVLSTYTSAGISAKADTTGKAGAFAIALEAYTPNDSNGLIKAILVNPGRLNVSTAVTYGLVASMAADGLGAANVVGVGDAARVDHVHTNTADTPALTLSTSNSSGSAGSVLAANATVAMFDTTVPTTIQSDASASVGTVAFAARRDHIHGIVCDPPVDGSIAAANAEGTASSFSRSDHAHRMVVKSDVDHEFGTAYNAKMRWSTADADNNSLALGLDNTNRAFHISSLADIATDWNVSADGDPALYVHSETTPATDYLKLYHNSTDAFFSIAGGNLKVNVPTGATHNWQINSGTVLQMNANTLAFQQASSITTTAGNLIIAPNGGATDITGTLDVSGHVALGSGASITTSDTLSVADTWTDPAGYRTGLIIDTTAIATAANNQQVYSGLIVSRIGATNTSNWTENIEGLRGLEARFVVTAGATGTISLVRSLVSLIQNNAAGATITNAMGVYVTSPVVTGPITNLYGVYVAAMTGGGTTNYGIYVANGGTYAIWTDAGTNRFDGSIVGATGAGFTLTANTMTWNEAITIVCGATNSSITSSSAGVARNFTHDITVGAGGAANALLEHKFMLASVYEAGLSGETNGAGGVTAATQVWKVPYRDSGVAVAAPAALNNQVNGGARVEAGDDMNRWYFRANEGWHYINQTAGLSITAEERFDPWTNHKWETGDVALVRMAKEYGDGGADFLPYPLSTGLKNEMLKLLDTDKEFRQQVKERLYA